MNQDSPPSDNLPDARTYFAAERTLLAWIRTGLAMMGFGFVVARFGLFLRELAATTADSQLRSTGFSLIIGTLLVLCGVAVNIAAAIRHFYTVRRLERGETLRFNVWSLGMTVGLLLALIGLLMAAYLMAELKI